jgi:hypothetical protein
MRKFTCFWPALCLLLSCHPTPHYDTIIRHGTIYDGTGDSAYTGDIGIQQDTLAYIGDLSGAQATRDIGRQRNGRQPRLYRYAEPVHGLPATGRPVYGSY